MIELRWLPKIFPTRGVESFMVVKVLQFRTVVGVQGGKPFDAIWSEWQDVPEVSSSAAGESK